VPTDDRTAIENTLQAYFRCLDGGDFAGYLATMTDDVKFYSKFATQVGKDAIADMIRPMMENRKKQHEEGTAQTKGMHHIVTNQALEFTDADNAVVRAYWMLAVAPLEGNINIAAMGSSEDHFVKQDSKWLIRERRVEQV
jgi:ketosteroid isomerase-like protein